MPQCGSCDIKIQSLLNAKNRALNSLFELSLLIVVFIFIQAIWNLTSLISLLYNTTSVTDETNIA